MRLPAATFCFACTILLSTAADADEARDKLDAAVAALGAGEYREGLVLLEESASLRDDPRLDYYRGYALEKLGECSAARTHYRAAARDPRGSAKLRALAEQTDAGVDERCVEARPRGGGRAGWKIFGWTTLTLGVATLALVPVQVGSARAISDEATPYFRERYGCDVSIGRVGGESCEAEALVADPAYQEYDDRARKSQRVTVSLVSVGVGLLGAGGFTLLSVGMTRPAATVTIVDGRPLPGFALTGRF